MVSSGNDDDRGPIFDRNGKYLFFVSKRHANPIFSQTEFNIATLKMRGIYVATLTKEEPSLFAPHSDEGSNETEASRPSLTATPSPSATTGPIQAIKIDLDGLMERAVPVPVPAADYGDLAASRDSLFYVTAEGPGVPVGEEAEERKATLHAYDLKPRKERTVVTDLSLASGSYALSDDGSKVMYHKDDGYFIADSKVDGSKAAPGGEGGPTQLNLKEMRVQIDPRQEWVEMFEQAWRLERDFFYSTKMNGVDWDAVAVSYRKLLPLCGCREDLNYLIGEIIGELCNSHTYVGGGDIGREESSAKVKVGPGCRFRIGPSQRSLSVCQNLSGRQYPG